MARKIYGMTLKNWRTLGKILNPTQTDHGVKFETVAQYIKSHPSVKTERRISSKGTPLVKVFYPTGKIKEYPESLIDRTTAYEY